MDPAGVGRQRGFRSPAADPGERHGASDLEPTETAGSPPEQPVRRSSWRWLALASGLLVVAVIVIAALAYRLGSSSAGPAPSPGESPTSTPGSASALPLPDLYQQVVPSVVMITTSEGSLGSGVIVNDTGLVLTAHHVVADGGKISVLFVDGTRTTAKIAASNPTSDIATLTPGKLPEVVVPAVLGGGVEVGSDVVAVGNPLGLRDSTTTGVVSGLGRTTKTATGRLSGLIQFDAAVNPGSSGGPLLDARGLLVGVVVSIADPGKDDAFAGIGFAVPIGAALSGGDGEGPDGGGPRL
jgi:S1-C subfamily serine protease